MASRGEEDLRRFAAGDLRGWSGLPTDMSVADLTTSFPRDSDWVGGAQLGSGHRPAEYLWVNFPTPFAGPDGKLRAWFDDKRILLLDLACEGLPVRPGQLKNLLGEAPAILDTWQGTLPRPHSELVFPVHGLAAFINQASESVWHLALFPPSPLETYTRDLRIDMQVRRRPALENSSGT